MRRRDETGQWADGLRLGAVLLEETAVDVQGYWGVLELFGEVRVDADVEVGAVVVTGEFVEERGEPEEVVFVADDPVEVCAAVEG